MTLSALVNAILDEMEDHDDAQQIELLRFALHALEDQSTAAAVRRAANIIRGEYAPRAGRSEARR